MGPMDRSLAIYDAGIGQPIHGYVGNIFGYTPIDYPGALDTFATGIPVGGPNNLETSASTSIPSGLRILFVMTSLGTRTSTTQARAQRTPTGSTTAEL